jgi:hypothetical protein
MDAYDQNDIRDENLAAVFFPLVQQASAWPTIESETRAYQAQRDALRKDILEGVQGMVSYAAGFGDVRG